MTALSRGLFAAFVVGLGFSITLAESALAALVLVPLVRAVLLVIRGRRGLREIVRDVATWPLAAPVGAFCAVTLLSALVSGFPAAALSSSRGLLLIAALYVTVAVLRDVEDTDRFVGGLTLVLTASAVIGLLQVGLCPGPGVPTASPRWLYHRCDRAHGFFSIYMTLAGVLSLGLLTGLPRLLPGAQGPRRLRAIGSAVMLAGLVATYTRGAWIGFASGVLTVAAAVRRGRVLLVAGLALLALGALFAPYQLRHRFLSMADPASEGVRERVYMWRSGVAMWREAPVLGVGPGGVKRGYERYALPEAVKKRTGHVHNTPLQILVERGVLGLAAWLWIWVGFFRAGVGALRRWPEAASRERALILGSLAAVVGFLVGGLSEYNFGDSEVVMLAWAIMALPWTIRRERPEGPL